MLRKVSILLCILLICMISRLPQLTSPFLYLDSDESILALMAKHFLEGKSIPIFFYGQSYGFSIIEVTFISIFFSIFGISCLSFKTAILSLWSIGTIFFYQTLELLNTKQNKYIPFFFTLLLLLSPSWAIWSMKGRGGYVTAYVLFNLLTYCIFSKKTKHSRILSYFFGVFIILIFQSQPLWLIGLIPLLVFSLKEYKQHKQYLFMALGAISGSLFFFLIKQNISNFWQHHVLTYPKLSGESFLYTLEQSYYHLTGYYHLYDILISPKSTNIWAITMLLLMLIALLFTLLKIKIIFQDKPNLIYITISVLCTLGSLSILERGQPRYLLPLSGSLLIMLFCFFNYSNYIKTKYALLIFLLIFGAISTYQFKDFSTAQQTRAPFYKLLEELDRRNIQHFYCLNGMLQWQIIFYSNENIIGRSLGKVDRYPDYIKQTDIALSSNKKKVALITPFNEKLLIEYSEALPIQNSFILLENPSHSLLKELGFEFNT